MLDADWDRLINQLRAGDCTPFLGAGACDGTLPSGPELSRRYAERYGYPFADVENLAQVMQFAAMATGDPIYFKQQVCNDLRSYGRPDFGDPCEPHALLAEFPIPVFITTNYDDFLREALTLAGKRVAEAELSMCPWFGDAEYDKRFFNSVPGLIPTAERPFVYNLHGSIDNPRSLVLADRDYLEYMLNIGPAFEDGERHLIPRPVLSALTDNPLLFVGYGLQDWTFRVIFDGLLRSIPDAHRRRNVSVQLLPKLNGDVADAQAAAERYLAQYLEGWNISIYWGSVRTFCTELRHRMEGK